MKKIFITCLLLFSYLITTANVNPKAQEMASRKGLSFTENRGQVSDTKGNLRPDVLYTAENNGVKIYFRKDAISYVFPRIETVNGESAITGVFRSDVELVGSNANFRVISENQLPGVSNFYLGSVKAVGVKSFQKIVYQNIYNNIDLAFYTTPNNQLKYEFIVHSGGKVEDIKLRYNGVSSAAINRTGGIDVNTPFGNLSEDAPYTYQNGKEISSSFQLSGGVMTYKVGAYDPGADLVIDPLTRQYATNFGGSRLDRSHGVAMDGAGNTTVAGYTMSTNFPVTPGAVQATNGGASDVIVSSFSPSGALIFATYFGGSGADQANDVALDANGNVTVVGFTSSSNLLASNSLSGTRDGFIAQMGSTGALNWSKYWGGSMQDELSGVASFSNGDVAVVGYTNSPGLNTIGGAFSGTFDACMVRVTSSGNVSWSSYFGGTGDDRGQAVAVDAMNNIIIGGKTTSSGLATQGAIQSSYNGSTDAFVAKFDGSGSKSWSTYLGGTGGDFVNGITTNSTNGIFVTGQTSSTTFPTLNAFQSAFGGGTDGFITAMNPDGSMMMSSFIGGSSTDQGYGVLAVGDKVYVSGTTNSPNFPLKSPNADPSLPNQNAIAGASDIFTVRVDATTKVRDWAFLYGGSSDDVARDLAGNGTGSISIAGYTNSANVPVLNRIQGQLAAGTGNDDVFLIHLKDDVSGCPSFAVNATNTNPGCAGNDGSISVETPSGGKAPYTYSVNGGNFQAGNSFSGLSAGSYTVTVKDANNCTSRSASIELVQTSSSRISINVQQASMLRCNGDRTQLTINATLGTAPYQYAMNDGPFQIQNVFTNVPGGAYSITVKDSKGCIATTSGMVMEPGSITFDPVVTDANCTMGTRASLYVNVTDGGTPPYQYSIDGGMSFSVNPNFSGLLPGLVNVVVRDANNCTTGAPLPVQINSIGGVIIMDDQVISTNPTCGGEANGTITVVATDGSLPYTFSLNDGSSPRTVNTSTFTFSGLAAGNYNVTVKDGGGCMDSKTVQLNDPKPLVVASVQALQPTTCNSSNGALTITAVGGEEPYSYSIDNGQTFSFSNVFEGLRSGTYTVMVRDRAGFPNACTATATKELTQLNSGARILSVEKRDPICSNSDALYTSGEIVIKAIGSSNILYYSIDNGDNYIPSATGGATFSYLSPGFYKIRVATSPDNDCSEYREITLETPDVVRIVSVSTDQPACGTNPYIGGTISITAAGGSVGVYKYSLDGGATFQDSEIFTDVVPRPEGFNIRVIDNSPNGCVADYPTVYLSNPSGLMMTKPLVTTPQCGMANGIATTTPSGGTLPYTFYMDGVLVPQDMNSNATFTFKNLNEGRHMLEVRDAMGCRAQSEIDLKAIRTTISTTPVTGCLYPTRNATAGSGVITVNITTNSNGPFRYTLKGTNFRTCSTAAIFPTYNSPANNARTFTFSPTNGNYITPGMYIVEVTDLSNANNCVSRDTVNMQHQEIDNVNRGGRVTNISYDQKNCNFSTGTGNPNTGTIKLTYTGTLNTFHLISEKGIWRTATSNNASNPVLFTGLPAGTYRIWSGNCSRSNSTNLGCLFYEGVVTITQPPMIEVKVSVVQTDCANNPLGRVTVTATGGQSLQFRVSNTAYPDLNSFQTYANNTFVIDNIDPTFVIGAGQIQVRELASANCQYNYPLPIQFNKTSNLSIARVGNNTNAGCSNVNNGATTVKVMAGTVAPYSYYINGVLSTTTTAIQHTFTNLRPGVHLVMVKDANGCARSYRTEIGVSANLFDFTVATTPSGFNQCNDGTATITLTGAQRFATDFMLSINGGGTFSGPGDQNALQFWLDRATLPAGNYEFVVKRVSNLCEVRKTVTIGNTNDNLSPITINYMKFTNPTCPEGSDGTIEMSVTLTDLSNNLANNFIKIEKSASPTNLPANDLPFENLSVTGTYVVKASGLSTGTYEIKISNASNGSGCRIQNDPRLNITILNPVFSPITIANVAVTRPDCATNPTGSIVINASGGTGTLEYTINGGISWQTSPIFNGIPAGTKFPYGSNMIRVRQMNNTCSSTEVVWPNAESMILPSGLDFELTVSQPGCDGLTKGKIVFALLTTTTRFPVSVVVNGNTNNTVVFTTPGDVNTFSLSDLAPGNYTFVATDASNCVLRMTKTISTGDNISVNFNARNTTACGNSDGQIDYELIGGDISADNMRERRLIANGIEGVYETYGSANTISSGTLVYPTLSSGLYFIEVKNVKDNCVSSSAPIFINDPNSATVRGVRINAPTNQNCNNGSIVITLGGVGSGNIRYEISKDRGLTWMSATPNNGGQTSPYFTGLTEGRYFLRVRSGFNAPYCYRYDSVGTLKCTFGQTKSEEISSSNLNVYPNPTQGTFDVSYNAVAAEVVSVKVMDITGRVIVDKNYSAIEGTNSFDVNISNEASGVYLVQVTTTTGVNTLKVVKE